ncbi:hypothetical protein AcW1_006920 [Taiwanofungus camphoratus]|nr:hypothetical protein AcW1_006920 [Antrodia cinnamomea]
MMTYYPLLKPDQRDKLALGEDAEEDAALEGKLFVLETVRGKFKLNPADLRCHWSLQEWTTSMLYCCVSGVRHEVTNK